MKTFHCQFCGHPLFFENVQCLQCGSALAFLPDRLNMVAIEEAPDGQEGLWRPRSRGRKASDLRYRLCHNHTTQNACNFAVPAQDPNRLCVSCRLTRVLPDLSVPANPLRWYRLEVAKRRLFYALAKLGLVATNPPEGGADGPIFEFLADLPGQPVMTGHAQGVITLNVAEADDAERVRRREEMHEPYRTLLGHLRHESGHYYWDRLIDEGGRTESFRKVFGDEQQDYQAALQAHYARGGTVPDWQDSFVSEYATAHPWEDWAETWAHYLHMVDLLETAASYNTRLRIPGQDVEVEEVVNPLETGHPDFDSLVEQWVPLTLLVNSLNRSLGQEDAYPFALSPGALDKLRYVHDVISETRSRTPAQGAQPQQDKGKTESPPA
ncbi:zinc-binding metallopeptidase family protein [Ramlibacter alkalitolerans]|uniref:Zinc-binding peptidase n=1 Tax=Ramlibacter alkalitolerans TaxID=2039631 RepID=A0ABS1JQB3_9BURK|nr:putative zinc-binding peptidase [Ramlibacter alkalitolerans]MBL0426326.1 putative zinc-binding peptidase [Ramlibacter alkalitolerans]